QINRALLFISLFLCFSFFFVFFFFSSRRRHTRWPRDWSSDVCSSDLASQRGGPARPRFVRINNTPPAAPGPYTAAPAGPTTSTDSISSTLRSDNRRGPGATGPLIEAQ